MNFLRRGDPPVEITVSVPYDTVSVRFFRLRRGFDGSNRWLSSDNSGERVATTLAGVLKV